MKLRELYSKPINRAVNPAVSATKFDPETERVEIQEYVFTDEIINGLFRILDAIKNNRPYDHVGIWIDGYYGSGKSHFLKYLDYCITPHTRDAAMQRLLDAVKSIDPLDEKHNISFDYEQLLSIANWLKRATIDTCIFNLETSYDNSTDKRNSDLRHLQPLKDNYLCDSDLFGISHSFAEWAKSKKMRIAERERLPIRNPGKTALLTVRH